LSNFRRRTRPFFILVCASSLFSPVHARLGKDIVQKARRTIEASLTSANSSVREAAARALKDLAFPEEMTLLRAALKDPNEYVRIAAALSLSHKNDLSGAPVLQEILENTPAPSGNSLLGQLQSLAVSQKRCAAAKAMGAMGEMRFKPVLRQARQGDRDARVRDAAAIALARLGEKTELVVFQSAVADADEGVRQAAMEALAEIAHPESRDHFLRGLTDPAENVRLAALQGLQRLKDPAPWRDVAVLLKDSSALVGERAAQTLGVLGHRDAAAALRVSLDDPNGFTRLSAATALVRLGDGAGMPVLKQALSDADADIRLRGAEGLCFSATGKDKELLGPLLDDTNEKVKLAAAAAIWKQGGSK
jgi:HEAT repeat protein